MVTWVPAYHVGAQAAARTLIADSGRDSDSAIWHTSVAVVPRRGMCQGALDRIQGRQDDPAAVLLPGASIGTVRETRLVASSGSPLASADEKADPFRYFKTSSEVIRLAVMMYVRFPLSLRNVEDLLQSEESRSATRRCGIGGTDSGRCSQPRSGAHRSETCAPSPTGVGMSTSFS